MTQQPFESAQPPAQTAPARPSYTAGSGQYRQHQGQAQSGLTVAPVQHNQQPTPPVRYGVHGSGRSSAAALRVNAALARSRAWARPVGLGMRMLSYTLDVIIAALITVSTGLLSGNFMLAGIVLLEYFVIVMVMESRTGATPAQLIFRIRTTRDDSPFSLGFARALLRALVQGSATLVGGIGGWIMVATSSADPMKAGRSFADRAGRALVVKIPSGAEREVEAQRAAEFAAQGPRISIARLGSAPVALQYVPARQYTVRTPVLTEEVPQRLVPIAPPPQIEYSAPWEGSRSNAGMSVSLPLILPNSEAMVTMSQGSASAPAVLPEPGPVQEGVAPSVPTPVPRSYLRLSFDTGQNQLIPTESVICLGRKPEAVSGDEQLVSVLDPDGTVSKNHLRIEHRAGELWLIDQGSTNGSELFDEAGQSMELKPGERVLFEDGSRIRIGHRSLTIAFIEAD